MGTIRGTADVESVREQLVHARREILVTVRGDEWFDVVTRTAPAALRRAVQYRVVLPNHAGQLSKEPVAGLVELGAHIRTVPVVPLDAIVIDGAGVVLPKTQRNASDATAVVNGSVVAAAIGVFEYLWRSGTPFGGRDLPAMRLVTARERKILKLLADGYADESIATRIGVSVRTVRRTISTAMDRLEARSRFQAGVRAAKDGWLDGNQA